MRRLLSLPVALVVLAAAQTCSAQQSDAGPRREQPFHEPAGNVAASGLVTPTPEMWFYEQEQQRYDDPQLAIRRRAEARGQERRDRIESMRWYGMSNARPTVSITPWCGGYSDHWAGNSYDPQRWRPMVPTVVARPTLRY
jgi:hypothetical protein